MRRDFDCHGEGMCGLSKCAVAFNRMGRRGAECSQVVLVRHRGQLTLELLKASQCAKTRDCHDFP